MQMSLMHAGRIFVISLIVIIASWSPVRGLCAVQEDGRTQISIDGTELVGVYSKADADHAPVALLIPGSGFFDEDGNIPPQSMTFFAKKLSSELRASGISLLRFRERTENQFSRALAGAPAGVLLQHSRDTLGWLEKAKQLSGNNCVWLIGHSEGAVLAVYFGAGRADICGYVLLAPPGRGMYALLRSQFESYRFPPAMLDDLTAALDAILRTEGPLSFEDSMRADLFVTGVQRRLLHSTMKIKPADLLATDPHRALVIRGSSDVQISKADVDVLSTLPTVQIHELPGLNHYFMPVTGLSVQDARRSYLDSNRQIDTRVIWLISQFINGAIHY